MKYDYPVPLRGIYSDSKSLPRTPTGYLPRLKIFTPYPYGVFTPIEIFAHGTTFQPLKIQIQIFQSKKIYQKTQLSIMEKIWHRFRLFYVYHILIFYPVPLRGIYPD